MAMDKDFPQIETQILAADELEKEEESHSSINYISYNSDEFHNRHTPRAKLSKVSSRVYTKVRAKFKRHRRCVWSSKPVIIILLWNLIISVGFRSFFDPSLYAVMFNDINNYLIYDDDDYFLVMLIYGLPYGL